MNIIPISSMPMMAYTPAAAGGNTNTSELPFGDMFKQALQSVQETQAVKTEDAYALATGDVDNLAQVMINAEKADVAVQMLVQMRNKVMDAYTEIMRMNV